MRITQLFGRTLRQAPATITRKSEQLLVRAGFARRLPDRSRAELPLSSLVTGRLVDLFKTHNASFSPAEVMLNTDKPQDRLLALGKQELESYKDLPQLLFTRYSDQDGSIIKGVLFSGASRENDAAKLTEAFDAMLEETCGAPSFIRTSSGRDALGYEMADGHQEIFITEKGLATTPDATGFLREDIRARESYPLQVVATPGCKTIAELCDYLGANEKKTLKAVFFSWQVKEASRLLLVMLRGTLDVDEKKLITLMGGGTLTPASESHIIAAGAVPGYASPIGLNIALSLSDEGLIVIGDTSLTLMDDSITGANQEGYHVIHATYPRDFNVTLIADVARAISGAISDADRTQLRETRADVVISFDEIVDEAGSYLTDEGRPLPITAQPFTINLTAWIEQIVETHHDDDGILWPSPIAPFDIHLLTMAKEDDTRMAGEALYNQLEDARWRVLFDPRGLSPGVKFSDADLIGCPIRLTLSDRSMKEGGVELKLRWEKTRETINREALLEKLASIRD